eukprot:773908-Pelagomonas_calceolata.AAC.1
MKDGHTGGVDGCMEKDSRWGYTSKVFTMKPLSCKVGCLQSEKDVALQKDCRSYSQDQISQLIFEANQDASQSSEEVTHGRDQQHSCGGRLQTHQRTSMRAHTQSTLVV